MDQAKPFPVFRAGRFRSMEGRDVAFGVEQLQAIADSYDPANSPAPLVVGHPKHDTPAQGWIERLSVVGDRLMAHPRQLAASFAAAVNEGRYSRVSLQFFGERDPANPKPGSLYPRHVGFLGGAAPGVTGLGTVSFADGADPDQLTTIENDVASFAADLATDTTEEEPPVADTPDIEEQNASFAARESSLTEREAALQQREAAIAEREAEAARAAAETIHNGNVSFAATLVAGALLPAHAQDLVVGLLDTLEGQETVSFGAGNGELTGAAAFRKLFEGAQPLVKLGEAAAAEAAPAGATVTVSFAAPQGFTVDAGRDALYQRAKQLQNEDPSLSIVQAAARAEAEQKGA